MFALQKTEVVRIKARMTDRFGICQDSSILGAHFGCHEGHVNRDAELVKCLWNYGILQKQLKGHDLQCRLVGRLENYRTCCSSTLHLQPPRRADTPTITRFQPRKTVLRHRRREIVSQFRRDPQKLFSNHAAYRVHT